MLICNLAALLAARKMKLVELSTLTGISRTTLTLLHSGQGKAVHIDTIDVICDVLKIGVGELFTHFYLVKNFSVKTCTFDTNGADIMLAAEVTTTGFTLANDLPVRATFDEHLKLIEYKMRSASPFDELVRRLPYAPRNAVVTELEDVILQSLSDALKITDVNDTIMRGPFI